MAVLKYKTDGNVDPAGKPRVYFTCILMISTNVSKK